MLTYGALSNAVTNPSNRWTQFIVMSRRRIPVRPGVGTQVSSPWRTWVKLTAFIVPPFIHATLFAALGYSILRDFYMPWWLALPATCALWIVLIWFGNIILDRHIFKRVIWLRRARCRPFRTPALAALNRELLEERRQIMLALEASHGKVPRRRSGDPPRIYIGFVRSAPCTLPRWRTLIPIEVIAALYVPIGSFVVLLPSGLLAAWLLGSSSIGQFLIAWAIALFVAFIILLAPVTFLERRWKSRIFGMLHGHCPQCRHDLSTLTAENSSAGPRRCPECGSHWPLVPPPTPKELHLLQQSLTSQLP